MFCGNETKTHIIEDAKLRNCKKMCYETVKFSFATLGANFAVSQRNFATFWPKFPVLQTAVSQRGLVLHLWLQFHSFATQLLNLAPHFHNFAKIAKLRTTVSQVVANLCSCETEKKSRNKVVNMPLRGVKVCFIPFIRF